MTERLLTERAYRSVSDAEESRKKKKKEVVLDVDLRQKEICVLFVAKWAIAGRTVQRKFK